jgi:hypothetical protein
LSAVREAKTAASSAGRSKSFIKANDWVERAEKARGKAISAVNIAKAAFDETKIHAEKTIQAAQKVNSSAARKAVERATNALSDAEIAYVSIYDADEKRQHFGMIGDAKVGVYDIST